MFPFWKIVIAPVLQAGAAKRVVEIGALRGDNTDLLLDQLGPDAELHVIDPVPQFDADDHQQRFLGRYVFHEARSLDVLGDLGVFDAALIDGDHNWYTVLNELRLLAANSDAAGAELPVCILHDVGWPYGRRDLYYNPSDIPDEFRQPYDKLGMTPNKKRLLAQGGLNSILDNALIEGGERNGVMTAVDDFLAEYERPVRRLVLPSYFGLAILVDEARLARQPELAAVLDHLESSEGRKEQLELAEELRIRVILARSNALKKAGDELSRARDRHLKVLKAALLNEHYFENEVRFAHIAKAERLGQPVEAVQLRDPVRDDRNAFRRMWRERTTPSGPTGASARSFIPYTAMGRRRIDELQAAMSAATTGEVAGDFVECGAGRGGGAIFMRAYLDAFELTDRKVWVVDQFRSANDDEVTPSMPPNGLAGFRSDLNIVRDGFERFGLLDDQVRFLQGEPKSVLVDTAVDGIAVLRIGWGMRNAKVVLDKLYERLSPGARVIIDDCQEGGPYREQVDRFRAEKGIADPIEWIDDGCLTWTVSSIPSTETVAMAPEPIAHAPLIAPVPPADQLDLSVVIVFYNMARESKRSLHALSRAYQQRLDGYTYEVIAVDNGSSPEQALTSEFVRSFGPEFRLISMGDSAKPSPVPALNLGVAQARGAVVAMMIDGAHIVSPGTLFHGLKGMEAYAPALVGTQQWYVGPGQQSEAMEAGYDQEFEDRLFKTIKWPTDGYRLFDISHFIGERDWLDGIWESNCLFASHQQLEQVGAFEESFSIAGGGYSNLEIYERLGSDPNINVVTILGEGSFHQTHGGTTTNQPDPVERRRRIHSYGEQYAEMRGRPFRGPGLPLHYVGHIHGVTARRSKARRMSTNVFAEASASITDGMPAAPTPVPEELRNAFVEAVWRNLPWTTTTWLGEPLQTPPTDLVAYQELLARLRPDWVIITGDQDPGRALFMATMCDLVDHGEVVLIGEKMADDRPAHPRIHHLIGRGDDPTIGDQVAALTDETRNALVILGSARDRIAMQSEFNLLAPMVPVGSYVVVTDTIVNGYPVWPAFGPGPREAVRQLLRGDGNFVADAALEKYSLSFNSDGYLRRVR